LEFQSFTELELNNINNNFNSKEVAFLKDQKHKIKLLKAKLAKKVKLHRKIALDTDPAMETEKQILSKVY